MEEIIKGNDDDEDNKLKSKKVILKKGNKLIEKTLEPETSEITIVDPNEEKDKDKKLIKRTISNKNRVINQLIQKNLPEEKIIAQNETTSKNRQKKGITFIKEEPIILNLQPENKVIINQKTLNKNEVTEEEFEIKDNDKNKIYEKKYPVTQDIIDLLTPLGIEIEEEKVILKGKNDKIVTHGKGKEEDKKEEKKEEKKEDPKDKESSKKEKKSEQKMNWVGDVDFMDVYSTKVQLPHHWRTHPRTYGKDSRYCRVCRNTHGLIRKYGLNICRKCFRERAHLIGFKQTK